MLDRLMPVTIMPENIAMKNHGLLGRPLNPVWLRMVLRSSSSFWASVRLRKGWVVGGRLVGGWNIACIRQVTEGIKNCNHPDQL